MTGRSRSVEAGLRRLGLGSILERVLHGRRLGRDDGLRLSAGPDASASGYLANLVRERRHGDRTWFVRDHHLNPTNVCLHACAFCAFARRRGQDGAYEMQPQEIERRAREFARLGVNEVHVVGGVHPQWRYDDYLEVLRILRRSLPGAGLKAWTAVEVDRMVRLSGKEPSAVLTDLRAAGLDHLAGGGAEIFAPEIRRRICASKIDGACWLQIHRAAHSLGIPTNCSMLHGHLEEARHRVDHLLALRAVQDAARANGAPGFTSYIPLPFHPAHTSLSHLPGPSAEDNLRAVALGRLLLDNVPHVKAYWVMMGVDTARAALDHGADDLGGTVLEERIVQAAGGVQGQALTPERIAGLIRAAGRVPVERDAHYRPVAAAEVVPC